MTDIRKTTTVTTDQPLASETVPAERHTEETYAGTVADKRSVAQNVVWYILGLIEALLALRFIMKLAGANPNNGFVDLIYSISGVLVAPFQTIFGTPTVQTGAVQSVFEPATIVAAIVYLLVAWAIAKLFALNRPRPEAV